MTQRDVSGSATAYGIADRDGGSVQGRHVGQDRIGARSLNKGALVMPSIASKFKVTNKFQRFEYVDEKSSKFWEIRVAGLSVDVCFGRIGTKGSNQSKLFPGAEMARSHAEKLLLEKVGKGYVVASKSEGKPAIAPLARSPEKPGKRVVKKVPSKRPLEMSMREMLSQGW